MKRLALTIGMVALLTGCAAPAVNIASSPTPTGLPPISDEATCVLLFGASKLDGPIPDLTDIVTRLVANPDGSTITFAEIVEAREAIDSARKTASEELLPYLDAQIDTADQLESLFTEDGSTTVNFDAYKASALQLLTVCT